MELVSSTIEVIFCDVDGVLTNLASLRTGNTAQPDCVAQLNRIIEATGAVIKEKSP